MEADRRMVDAAYGGNILNVTHDHAMAKITEMAEGTRNFGRSSRGKGVNYVGSSRSDDIDELKEMIKKLTLQGTPQQVKACGICLEKSHPTDDCPHLQEETAEANVVGGYQRPQNDYNQRYRDQPPQLMQRQQGNGPSTEKMLNTLTQHFTTHVQATE